MSHEGELIGRATAGAPTTGRGQGRPYISVVVPVWNDRESLGRCLRALAVQSFPREDFEIIVVDNGSQDSPAELCREFPDVRWLSEPTPGSYAARNQGILAARGGIIALTDADCVPAPSWLAQAAEDMRRPQAQILGGRIEYLDPVGRALNCCEIWEEVNTSLGDQRRLIDRFGFAVTANLVVRRSVFERVGLFNPALKSSGDKDWTQAAVRRGERLAFAAGLVVRHPRRSTFRAMAQKRRRVAGGMIAHLKQRRARFWEIGLELWRASPLDPRIYFSGARVIRHRPELVRVRAKLEYLGLSLALATVGAFEKLRVAAGASSRRS